VAGPSQKVESSPAARAAMNPNTANPAVPHTAATTRSEERSASRPQIGDETIPAIPVAITKRRLEKPPPLSSGQTEHTTSGELNAVTTIKSAPR
jgi:hypothetical protein